MEPIRRLQGMRDLTPDQFSDRARVVGVLGRHLETRGYQFVETPVLEETELFMRKSGGELAARMYSFTDDGGNKVSLRPEFTSSVLRAYIGGGFSNLLPIRVQYGGPVFRQADLEASGTYQQFTQVGAELLGAPEGMADVEIISIACRGLEEVGVKGLCLTMGHVGVLSELLMGFGLSERAHNFLLSNISRLGTGSVATQRSVYRRAEELGLMGVLSSEERIGELAIGPEQAEKAVRYLVQEVGGIATGGRTQTEIMNRLLRRIHGADEARVVEKSLEFSVLLAGLKGSPDQVMDDASKLAREYGLREDSLQSCRRLLRLLSRIELMNTTVTFDFSLARGIAYYTGLVFSLSHPSLLGEPSLGGGGRYDSLPRALGKTEELPALGFAWCLERILELVGDPSGPDCQETGANRGVLIKCTTEDALVFAEESARRIRERGTYTEFEVLNRSLEQTMLYASSRGLSEVIVVDEEGHEESRTVLRTNR